MNTPYKSAIIQPSHVLMVLANPAQGQDINFGRWLKRLDREIDFSGRLACISHYQKFPLTISDAYQPMAFAYLSICRLNLDGAGEANELITNIQTAFSDESSAGNLATWLYYPMGEKIGAVPDSPVSYISIAFANAVQGRDQEFREWYVTRHIRHALIIPALVNGQVFELTGFQKSFSAPEYQTIAVYEMDDTPESLMESLPDINPDDLEWSPAGDVEQFTEWFYQKL